jgi:hypothetical protein
MIRRFCHNAVGGCNRMGVTFLLSHMSHMGMGIFFEVIFNDKTVESVLWNRCFRKGSS